MRQIANLYSTCCKGLGLLRGKIGISLFFFHYAHFCGDSLYSELIGDVYDDIRIDTPWGIRNGLLGIGWGLEYFMQKGFVECDSNDILTELDNKIMERDLRRVKDYSFDTG